MARAMAGRDKQSVNNCATSAWAAGAVNRPLVSVVEAPAIDKRRLKKGSKYMKNIRRTLLAVAATIALSAGCGGGFTQEQAVATLVTELGMTEAQAACSVDAIENEMGSIEMLEDPNSINDEDGLVVGELMVLCLQELDPSFSNRTDKAPTDDESAASTDGQQASDDAAADIAEQTVDDAPAATPGGVGDWTAAQLCTLADGADVSAAFGTVELAMPFEQWEDSDRSICVWEDPDSPEVVPPTLLMADQEPATGPILIDGTSIDIAGAAEVDYRPDWLPGEDFLVLTARDQKLTLRYQSGHAAAYDLAVQAASTWSALQAG